jgi:hypothetical protein
MRYSFYDILTQYNPMDVSDAYYKYYDDVAIYLENYVEENLEDVAGFHIEVRMALYMYFSDVTKEINEETYDEMLLELFQYI